MSTTAKPAKVKLLADTCVLREGSAELDRLSAGETVEVAPAVAERLVRVGAAEKA